MAIHPGPGALVSTVELADGTRCRFAIVIADAWQGRGLARQLLASLIQVARDRGFKSMTGTTMKENRRMLDLARSMGFEVEPDLDDPRLRVMDIDL